MKGATADSNNMGRGYKSIIQDLGDHSVPEGWVQRPKFNDKGDVPGPPIQWQKPEDPDNPIKLVDSDGKKIKDPDGIVKNYKNRLSGNINNLQEMINISAVESSIGGELMSLYKTALEEISKLEKSDQVYTIFSDKSSKEEGMSYDMVSGEVKIGIGNNSIGIVGHELIHAYQYEEGKVSLVVDNSGYGQLYDITDETKAYNRERALGMSIQFFQTPKIVVNGNPLQMSDRDVKTFGNSMSSPAYQTLPSRSIDIKSKAGKMLRQQTKQTGS